MIYYARVNETVFSEASWIAQIRVALVTMGSVCILTFTGPRSIIEMFSQRKVSAGSFGQAVSAKHTSSRILLPPPNTLERVLTLSLTTHHRYLKDLSEAFVRIKTAIQPVPDTADTDEAPSMDDNTDNTDDATIKPLSTDLVSLEIRFHILSQFFFLLFLCFCFVGFGVSFLFCIFAHFTYQSKACPWLCNLPHAQLKYACTNPPHRSVPLPCVLKTPSAFSLQPWVTCDTLKPQLLTCAASVQ